MSAELVVPDGIEPIEEWRTWRFDGKILRSHNGQEWNPGEPLKAECQGGAIQGWTWSVVRGGMSVEAARTEAQRQNEHLMHFMSTAFGSSLPYLSYPSVEPPAGYGYALESVAHDTPQEDCTCGIYAARTEAGAPSGDVLGKVKMWGKIVPGTQGSRAEYAYPSELHVPLALADDPAILAYGVPVVVTDSKKVSGALGVSQFSTALGPYGATLRRERSFNPWPMRFVIAANIASAALNFLVALKVVKF